MYATLNNERQSFSNSMACSQPFEDVELMKNILTIK